MTRAEILAFNRGVAALIAVAEASAAVLHQRIAEAPTRFNYAIAALDGIVEAGNDLLLPLPPDGMASALSAPTPAPINDGIAAAGAA